MTAALAKTITLLRAQAAAPRHEQSAYARAAVELDRVPTTDAGDAAAMLAAAAKTIARQAPRVRPETLEILRDVQMRLADALVSEAAVCSEPCAVPYWMER